MKNRLIIEWEKIEDGYEFNLDMEEQDVLEVLGVLEMMKIDVLARSNMKPKESKR